MYIVTEIRLPPCIWVYTQWLPLLYFEQLYHNYFEWSCKISLFPWRFEERRKKNDVLWIHPNWEFLLSKLCNSSILEFRGLFFFFKCEEGADYCKSEIDVDRPICHQWAPANGYHNFSFFAGTNCQPRIDRQKQCHCGVFLRTSLEQTTDDEVGGVMYYTSRFVVYSCIYHFPVLSL